MKNFSQAKPNLVFHKSIYLMEIHCSENISWFYLDLLA